MQSRAPEDTAKRDAAASIRILLTDALYPDRRRIEHHSVRLDADGRHLGECLGDGCVGHVTKAEQIDVPRWTDNVAEPHDEHHCAFEHESIGVTRARKPMQEALRGITREHEVRIDTQFLRDERKAGLNRMFERCDDPHAIRVSMYGRITRSTRQTFAYRSISSIVTRRRCQASRSASIAMSMPMRLRNLKRSAIVFAMP